MKKDTKRVIHSDYYLENFHTLAGYVVSTYEDLLREDEKNWYESVKAVPDSAQRLYIRLLTRRNSIFRLSRLNYPEILKKEACAETLAHKALVDCEPPIDLATLLATFTKLELINVLSLHSLRNKSRAELLEHINNCEQDTLGHYKELLQQADKWVGVKGHAYWTLMQLCFFGNLYQDSSELILQQLGTVKYENYALDSSTRAFTSREQIDSHWRYFECATLYEFADTRSPDQLTQLANALPDFSDADFTLRRRVDRLRNRIARHFERLTLIDEALTLYSISQQPPARERRVRILLSRQQWHAAEVLCEKILGEPHNETERLSTERLFSQCRKAQGLSYVKQKIFKPASSTLVLHNSGRRVEETARAFFAQQGQCFHTENALVTAVLGLFIWDIIFHPLPGAFYNAFQSAPADFNQPQFSKQRKCLLDERFLELNDVAVFKERVQSNYGLHFGKVNPLVRWQHVSTHLLALALEHIPGCHWRELFKRILTDIPLNKTGLPDLTLFPAEGGYEFIEIKGPGDVLQVNQRRWMKFFDQHRIACRVVHIRYSDASVKNVVDEMTS